MTIRNTSNLSIDNFIKFRRNQSMLGTLFEDDTAICVRYFMLNGVEEYEAEPGNSQTKERSIMFTEGEIEYEYWYSLYGKPFEPERSKGMKQYQDSKHITFKAYENFDSELKFCIHQSNLSGIPYFNECIEQAMTYATYCEPFTALEEPF